MVGKMAGTERIQTNKGTHTGAGAGGTQTLEERGRLLLLLENLRQERDVLQAQLCGKPGGNISLSPGGCS